MRNLELRDLLKLQFVGDPQLAPDGRSLAYVQTRIVPRHNGYASTLWLAREIDGRWQSQQLTHPPTDRLIRETTPRFGPFGDRLCFLSNRGGRIQLWLLPLQGGEAYPLPTDPLVPAEPVWSPCGRYLCFNALEQEEAVAEPDPDGLPRPDVRRITRLRYKANGQGFLPERPRRLYLLDVAQGSVQPLTTGGDEDTQPAWSPDGRKIAFVRTHCRDEVEHVSTLWVIHVADGRADGEAVCLTARRHGLVQAPRWSPDGKQLAYFGHAQTGVAGANTRTWVVSAHGGEPRALDADLDQSAECAIATDSRMETGTLAPVWSEDGNAVYAVYTVGGDAPLYRLPLDGSTQRLSLPGEGGAIAAFSTGGGRLAYSLSSALNPANIYVGHQRVTDSNPWLRDIALATPARCQVPTSDGATLEGWWLRPTGSQPAPAILEIHGGPAVAYGRAFMFEFQWLAAHAYAVVYCNIRGSRGYGEAFCKAVVGDWGGVDLADVMSVADWMAAQPEVDAGRMGVSGGSYGGYLTNWIVGHSTRFQAAVSQRSISNLYSKYGTADNGFDGNRAGMGGADLWDAEDFLMERSPIRYAPQVSTPLLLIHSEEDHRCPMEQAEQFYVALKRLGKTVEFVRFAGENHDLSRSGKPANRLERLREIKAWFDRHLKPNPVATDA